MQTMHNHLTWKSAQLNLTQLAELTSCMADASILGMKIGLSGAMGAGKTQLVRLLMQALSCTDEVSSPTYAIHHVYLTTAGEVDHYDLYRLGPDEMADLELEYMSPSRTILIEWWQNYPELAKVLDLCITLEQGDTQSTRRLTLQGLTAQGRAWVEKLALLWAKQED